MMASAIRMALSCNFKVFYWAHDIHLWDGTIPFTLYTASIAPYATPTPTPTPHLHPHRQRLRPGQPGADRHRHGQ